MSYKIYDDIRRKIIRLWLEGKSRKDISLICNVSEGTVSNVITNWKQKLGEGDADALRELGSNLKRSGIDAAQCAQGHRISMILRKMEVNEEDFESFISKLYERCIKVSGLTPDKIGSYLEDLVEFSDEDNNGGNIPKLSELPQYIEQKKNENRALKKNIQNLQKQKKISEEEASAANDLRDAALENEKVTVAELREFTKFKTELGKYGLSVVDDTRKLVRVIYGVKQRNEYDVGKILSEYSDIEFMQEKRDMLSKLVRALEDKIVDLRNQYSFLESQVNLHSQRLYVYDELDSMGFGLTKLKILRNAIKEIAAEDNISSSQGVDKFFEFVEKHYDIKLRQKVQEAQQQQQHQKEYAKPDNLNPAFPSHHDFKPSNALPNQSSLVEKQRQRQLPSTSISYTIERNITNASKKTEEQNDQLNNDHDDGWCESDDDHSL
jgi:hypothetical protein